MKKQIILTANAPAPIGPYSQAVKVGDTLYVSGQIAINPATGDMNLADIPTETHQTMSSKVALAAAKTAFKFSIT